MSEIFDPYRKWLGIPPEEQPPHHYRLLGIGLYEDDPDVIENAADRQMAHVQTRRAGKYVEWTQKLLNELTKAKLCLLNPEKKNAYDSQLQQQLEEANPGTVASPTSKPIPQATVIPQAVVSVPAPAVVAEAVPPQLATEAFVVGHSSGSVAARARRRNKSLPLVAIAAAAALAVVVLLVVVSQKSDPPAADGSSPAVADGTGNDVATATHRPANMEQPSETGEQRPQDQPHDVSPFEEVKEDPKQEPSEPTISDPMKLVDPLPMEEPVDSASPAESLARSVAEWKRRPLDGQIERSALRAAFLIHPSFQPDAEIAESLAKQAVPSAAEIDRAKNLVSEVYAQDISAAQTAAEKIALAAEMYAEAAKEEEAGDGSYALLRAASLLAFEAGEIATSLGIVDAMGRVFEIDPVRVKANIVIQASENASINASDVSIAGAALGLIDLAVVAGDFELADQLQRVGQAAAEKSRNAALIRIAKSLETVLPLLKTLSAEYESARAVLVGSPEDPQANLTAGKYCCFVMGDWEFGLPLLLKGDDEALAIPAKLDLSGPIDETERAAVGDSWWEFADSVEAFAQSAIRARAIYWYELAVPALTGLARTKIERRLEQFGELSDPESAGPADLAQGFAGKYFLVETQRKTTQMRESVLDFQADFQVSDNGEMIGRWEVDDGNRIKLTMLSDPDSPLYLKPRGSSSGTITMRTKQGDTWQLTRLTIVSVWEHKTEAIRIFGRRIPEEVETLTFFSNGRVNDPLGGVRWTVNRQNLVIDWGKSKQTVAIVASGGKAYVGKTTAKTGFANTTLTRPVNGRLIDADQ